MTFCNDEILLATFSTRSINLIHLHSPLPRPGYSAHIQRRTLQVRCLGSASPRLSHLYPPTNGAYWNAWGRAGLCSRRRRQVARGPNFICIQQHEPRCHEERSVFLSCHVPPADGCARGRDVDDRQSSEFTGKYLCERCEYW